MTCNKQYRDSCGILYVVATPIGNLSDITFRAVDVLKKVDLIVSESVRHSKKLLDYYGITTSLVGLRFAAKKSGSRTEWDCIERMKQGHHIALISDSGTPLISDPGRGLVAEAHRAEVSVLPIPGACAAVSALSVAGLEAQSFVFLGFLPVKRSARQAQLNALRLQTKTLVFYEAPHRLLDCLSDMKTCLGEQRPCSLARELTKRFETVKSDTLGRCYDWLVAHPSKQKGEWVIVIGGATLEDQACEKQRRTDQILQVLLESMSVRAAVDLVVQITGEKRSSVYRQATSLRTKHSD